MFEIGTYYQQEKSFIYELHHYILGCDQEQVEMLHKSVSLTNVGSMWWSRMSVWYNEAVPKG
jgi:hypothetical protein